MKAPRPSEESGGAAAQLVRPSNGSRLVARLAIATLALSSVILVATPWQQTAPGIGRVIAFSPDERKQNIDAPTEGRVLRWYVREGSVVKHGDPIVDLSDNDPDVLVHLRQERDALVTRLDAAKARARSMEARIDSIEASRSSALSAAEARVRMAHQRVLAASQSVAVAQSTLKTAKLNVERQTSLAQKGLASKRQLELTELEFARAQADLERANVALEASRSEETALTSDQGKIGSDTTASIADATGAQSSSEVEVANASAELARVALRLARQSAQSVVAPRDGTILRIVANGHNGDIVKVGELLAVLVPETRERAVEIWVAGVDMPLVQAGAPARVQFEGWPALQFSGWPSVAIGTFAARVSFVDATDDGDGRFRVVIVPDPNQSWPDAVYLRQGVRVHAWVQLGSVSLGYELWRQFNGFPASMKREPAAAPEAYPAPTKGDAR